MKSSFKKIIFIVLFSAFAVISAQEETDVKGSADHPLLSRMPGYYISDYDEKDYNSIKLENLPEKDATWEGKYTRIEYSRKSESKSISMSQIVKNYKNAISNIGGKIIFDESRVLDAKIIKNGAATFVAVSAFNDGRDYELIIVESKPMEQEVTADASALNASIASTGKAAVYGIYFDTGKSEIKPESDPAITEIVKLLQQNTALKLYVVGHTDNTGTLDANLKLSSARAAAVVKALTGRGIGAERLKPAGLGPYSPAASNSTDEGKAKNRRVELVEQ